MVIVHTRRALVAMEHKAAERMKFGKMPRSEAAIITKAKERVEAGQDIPPATHSGLMRLAKKAFGWR